MRFSQLTRFRMGTLLVTIALIAAACGSDDNDAGADLITQTAPSPTHQSSSNWTPILRPSPTHQLSRSTPQPLPPLSPRSSPE